jgi:hypothetical protein
MGARVIYQQTPPLPPGLSFTPPTGGGAPPLPAGLSFAPPTQQARNPARGAPSRPAPASGPRPVQNAPQAAPLNDLGITDSQERDSLIYQGYTPEQADAFMADSNAPMPSPPADPFRPQPQAGIEGSSRDAPIDLGNLYADNVPLLKKGAWVRNGQEVYQLETDAYTDQNRPGDEALSGNAYLRRPNNLDRAGAFASAAMEQVPFADEAAVGLGAMLNGRPYSQERQRYRDTTARLNNQYRGERNVGGVTGFGLSFAAPGGAFIGRGANAVGRAGRAAAVGGAYGTLFGAGNTDGDLQTRLQAAGVQAALGATGGAAFQRGADVLGAAASRVRVNPSPQRQLSQMGVDLTPGQMAGGALRRIEDGLTSVPIMGDAIRDAQRRGLTSMNVAATNDGIGAVGRVNSAGRQGQGEAQQVVSDAYNNALQGVAIPRDAQLDAALTAVARQSPLPAEMQSGFNGLLNNYMTRFGQGIAGPEWKQLDSEIGAAIRAAQNGSATNPAQRLLADKLIQTRQAFQGALERADPLVRESVRRADRANAGLSIIRDAGQGLGTAARDGIWTPGDLNRAVRNADSSAGNRQYAQGSALLQQLSDNANSVLPSTVPDSGTPFRSLLNMGPVPAAGAIGSGVLNPLIPAAAGVGLFGGAALYGRGAQGLINRAYRASTPGAARQALADLQAAAARTPALQPVYEALQSRLLLLLPGGQTATPTTQ